MRNVRRWIEANNIDEPIEYVFESCDDGWGDVLKVLKEINNNSADRDYYYMQGYSRKFKKEVIQLQAAGTWAYESYKHWANTVIKGQEREKSRTSWKVLFRPEYRLFNTFDNRETLDRLVRNYIDMGGEAARGGKILR
jgi:hypothetical protein